MHYTSTIVDCAAITFSSNVGEYPLLHFTTEDIHKYKMYRGLRLHLLNLRVAQQLPSFMDSE